jgi:hypothetical protein
MNQRFIPLSVLLGILWLGFHESAFARSEKEAETFALLRLLDENLDLKDFQDQGITFKGVLDLISEKFSAKGKELLFRINYPAFKKGTTARSIVDGELPAKVPATARRLPVRTFLRMILEQEDLDATFLIRNGMVEIVTAKQTTPACLLQSKVTGAFYRETLEDVLQELSFQTGATLVLDCRAGDLAKTPIRAMFRNDVTLEAALCMVTEMAQLKMVVLPGGIFITTPAHANCMQKDMLTPAKTLGKKPNQGK